MERANAAQATKIPTMHQFVSQALGRSAMTVEQLLVALGGSTPLIALNMMLAGDMKFTSQMLEPLASALNVDPVRLTRLFLGNYAPDLLQLLDRQGGQGGPYRLTSNERRLIAHIREYTAGTDAVPVINDVSTVVALVML